MAFMTAATTVTLGSVAAARHSAPVCTLKTTARLSSSFWACSTSLCQVPAPGSLLQQGHDCEERKCRRSGGLLIVARKNSLDPGRIGSRRRQGGGSPRRETESPADERRKEPFLQVSNRRYREEGHQALDDAETLLAKASNPFGLVIRIAEEANEYLRNNKEESLTRKPILKVMSDRINEAYGENIRDSYLYEKEDYSEFEAE